MIPWQLFLGYAAALYPVWAIERMNTAEAIGLAFASEKDGPTLWRQVTRDAYPVEEVLHG